MNPLLLGAAIYFGSKLIGQSQATKKLDFDVIGVKKKDGKLNIVVNFINPAGTTIQVDAMFLSVFLMPDGEGKPYKVGAINITKDKSFKITKRGITTVYLPITLAGLGLVGLVAEIIRKIAKKELPKNPKAKVIGTIVSMGLTTTIDEEVPIDFLT